MFGNKEPRCFRHKCDAYMSQLGRLPQEQQEMIVEMREKYKEMDSKSRRVLLQGMLLESCMPQLSFLSKHVAELCRVDVISAVPAEIGLRIFENLDAQSLGRAAAVSRYWKSVADDDRLWYMLCQQHIGGKCKKCGWGLPIMPSGVKAPAAKCPQSRVIMDCNRPEPKESCKRVLCETPIVERKKPRTWKTVYTERLIIEKNWRHGKFHKRALSGHSGGVTCLQLSETHIISGSSDCTIRVWELQSGRCVRVLSGHLDEVTGLKFDAVKLVTGSTDETVRLWNWQNGKSIRILQTQMPVTAVGFEGGIVACGGQTGSIHVWNFDTGHCFGLEGHTARINDILVHTKDERLFSASCDHTIRMWSVKLQQSLCEFIGHTGPVLCARLCHEFASNNSLLVTGSADNTVRVWTVESAETKSVFFGHTNAVNAVAVNHLRVISGSSDGSVKVWDLEDGKNLHTLNAEQPIRCVGMSETTIVGGDDVGLQLWELA